MIFSFLSCTTKNRKLISKWPNGQIKLEEISTDTPNVYNAREFYENGQLATDSRIENSKLNGKSVAYYKDGKLLGITEYKDSKINGQVLEFHRNGRLMFKGTQENGELVDTSIHYYQNGQPKIILLFKENRKIVINKFDSSGKTIKNATDSLLEIGYC